MKQDITIETKALTLAEEANKFPKIRGHKHMIAANEIMKAATMMIKEIKAVFKSPKEKTHAAWKSVLEEEGKLVKPNEEGVAHVKGRIREYLVEQQRLREEAEEKERLRLAAERAAERGKEEKAQQIQEQVDEIPTTKPAAAYVPPKLEGTHTREVWDYEITDLKKLLKEADPQFLLPNHTAIRGCVQTQKDMTAIPGVRVFKETKIVNR